MSNDEEVRSRLAEILKGSFPPKLTSKDLLREIATTREDPWKMPPEIRRDLVKRQRLKSKSNFVPKLSLRENLIFGLKSCLRHSRRGEVEVILFDREAALTMTSLTDSLSASAGLKVAAVDRLSDVVEENCGFKTAVMAVKNPVNRAEQPRVLRELLDLIELRKSGRIAEEKKISSENVEKASNSGKSVTKGSPVKGSPVIGSPVKGSPPVIVDKRESDKDPFLKRKDRMSRSFHPPVKSRRMSSDTDFIML